MAELNQSDLLEIGNRIVERREELGMKASELAIQVGITAAPLSYIESGQKAAKASTLTAIAEALKVPFSRLQPKRLDKYSDIPKGLEALLPKLKEKSPAEQQALIRMFSAMIDTM